MRQEEQNADDVAGDPVTPPRKRLYLGRYAGRLSEPVAAGANLPKTISAQLELYLNWCHDGGLVDGQIDTVQFWQCTKPTTL